MQFFLFRFFINYTDISLAYIGLISKNNQNTRDSSFQEAITPKWNGCIFENEEKTRHSTKAIQCQITTRCVNTPAQGEIELVLAGKRASILAWNSRSPSALQRKRLDKDQMLVLANENSEWELGVPQAKFPKRPMRTNSSITVEQIQLSIKSSSSTGNQVKTEQSNSVNSKEQVRWYVAGWVSSFVRSEFRTFRSALL